MVYSGGVRSFVQAAAVCVLALSALPTVRAGAPTSSVSCQVSDGDKKFGIQAIVDDTCTKGGLGCFNKKCRFCKVLDTDKSKHFDTCLSHGVAFTSTTPVIVTQGPCQVSSGDVADGISAVTDSSCLDGGLGCYNDHCRFCKVVQTPQSAGFVACSKLDKSYNKVAAMATTAAPTVVATNAPATSPTVVTSEPPTTPPTIAPTATDAPTSTPTDAPTSTVTDAPMTEIPTTIPTEAPTVTDAPASAPTGAPTTDAPTSEPPTVAVTNVPATLGKCTIVPSAGDLEFGIDIVTDPLCASGGPGCLNDVCRLCKLKTTSQSDAYMDCALVNGAVSATPSTTVVPDATTETPSVAVIATDAPGTTTTDAADISTEAPITDAPDVTPEAPTPSDASTDAPVISTDGSVATEAPTPSDASTDVPIISADDSDATTDSPATDAPGASTDVPETPIVVTEAPASPTTCTLVTSADDTELGISVATDPSCKSGGAGCIDEVCRFCKVTTTIQSALYVDCALLEGGSPRSEAPVADSTVAPTDAATMTPDVTTETPITTEIPDTDAPSTETETPTVTEAPTTATETDAPTTDAPAATTDTLSEQPTCGIVAAGGDIAVGIHITTDTTCSGGGLGCINDLCRFCKVETTPQSETYVDCSTLVGFASDSEAPVTTAPVAITPAPKPSCELVASPGDASVGIRVITDATCGTGGIGCISDVCRFCKVITSIQSADFIDCVLVDGYTTETEAPAATTTPDATTTTPDATTSASSSEATCSRIASEGDFAVGVGIATDATCSAGGVGCIDDVCRFCQVTATVQSAAFVSCSSFPGYSPRTEAPVDTSTTSPTTDAPVAQASCDLVVSAGDAAVGISITGDAICAVGGVGCIDSVCRFCKVTTTVQSAAFEDCTSIAGFTLATDVPVDTTTPPVDSTTDTLAPTTSASCTLVVSEGDAAVGIDIVADASCQLGGIGCIDSVCRFCKAKTTEQSAAFVDCPAVISSSTAPSNSTSKPAGVAVSTSDVASGASSLPADASEAPVDTTATDVPQTATTTDGTTTETPITDAPVTSPPTVGSTTSGSDEDDRDTEAPSAGGDSAQPTEAPTTTSDPIDTTGDTDVPSTEASQGSVDTTSSTNVTESPDAVTSNAVQGSTKDDNDTLTEAPQPAAVADTSDLLTDAPKTPTEAPTKAPAVDGDVDWEGSESESAEGDSDSTYDDSDESLGEI
ncbi:hypothetical protein PRIC1_008255 [Phytophthora ramorum]